MSECVLSRDPECDFRPGVARENLITAFCGNALECRRVGLTGALQAAKANVERHYAVVGFLDDVEAFVRVLEAICRSSSPELVTGEAMIFQ